MIQTIRNFKEFPLFLVFCIAPLTGCASNITDQSIASDKSKPVIDAQYRVRTTDNKLKPLSALRNNPLELDEKTQVVIILTDKESGIKNYNISLSASSCRNQCVVGKDLNTPIQQNSGLGSTKFISLNLADISRGDVVNIKVSVTNGANNLLSRSFQLTAPATQKPPKTVPVTSLSIPLKKWTYFEFSDKLDGPAVSTHPAGFPNRSADAKIIQLKENFKDPICNNDPQTVQAAQDLPKASEFDKMQFQIVENLGRLFIVPVGPSDRNISAFNVPNTQGNYVSQNFIFTDINGKNLVSNKIEDIPQDGTIGTHSLKTSFCLHRKFSAANQAANMRHSYRVDARITVSPSHCTIKREELLMPELTVTYSGFAKFDDGQNSTNTCSIK